MTTQRPLAGLADPSVPPWSDLVEQTGCDERAMEMPED